MPRPIKLGRHASFDEPDGVSKSRPDSLVPRQFQESKRFVNSSLRSSILDPLDFSDDIRLAFALSSCSHQSSQSQAIHPVSRSYLIHQCIRMHHATEPFPSVDNCEAWSRGQDLHLRLEVMSLSYCPTLLTRRNSGTLVRVAGVEPAWTCAQDMWVAATLHPDLKRGLCSPLLSTLSRRPPGAMCAPRVPDRAALPSLHQWTCTPSVFRR